MFGLFDTVVDSVDNAINVGLGVISLGEYGNFSQQTVSKMIADGIEIAVVAQFFDVTTDTIKDMID